MKKSTLVLIFLSLFLSLTLVGCGERKPDSSRLENRVLARWDALIKQDFKQAYTYFTPAYKKLYPLRTYLQSTGSNVKWTGVKVKEKSIESGRAEVVVNVRYRLNLPGPGSAMGDAIGIIDKDVKEIWLWREGNWWYGNPPERGI